MFDEFVMKAIQSLYTGGWFGDVLDYFFAAITFLGEESFIFLIALFFFWCLDKRVGEKMIFCMYGSLACNLFVKNAVLRPRPFVEYPGKFRHVVFDNFLIDTALEGSFSFPSGHAQGVASYITVIGRERKRINLGRSVWLIGAAAMLLVSVSRVYLGVHYPTDVVFGMAAGIVLTLLLSLLFDIFYAKKYILFFVLFAVMTVLYFLYPDVNILKMLGGGAGFLVGYVLEERFISFGVDGSKVGKFLRVLLGFAAVMAVKSLLKLVFGVSDLLDFLRYVLVGFTGAFLCPLIFTKLKI